MKGKKEVDCGVAKGGAEGKKTTRKRGGGESQNAQKS